MIRHFCLGLWTSSVQYPTLLSYRSSSICWPVVESPHWLSMCFSTQFSNLVSDMIRLAIHSFECFDVVFYFSLVYWILSHVMSLWSELVLLYLVLYSFSIGRCNLRKARRCLALSCSHYFSSRQGLLFRRRNSFST